MFLRKRKLDDQKGGKVSRRDLKIISLVVRGKCFTENHFTANVKVASYQTSLFMFCRSLKTLNEVVSLFTTL